MRLRPRPALQAPRLADLLTLDDPGFRALFAKSPVKRIGRDRFLRNVLYAAGNSDDPTLTGAVIDRLDDVSALVRGAAAWALSRLDHQAFAAQREARLAIEPDPEVMTEWASPLPSDRPAARPE
jgi:epoxyqueuosine reductase